jgi:hypothetical protein
VLSVNYDISYFNNGKQVPGFNTNIEYVDVVQSQGPTFSEEKEVPKGQPAAEQQSFLSKYVNIMRNI